MVSPTWGAEPPAAEGGPAAAGPSRGGGLRLGGWSGVDRARVDRFTRDLDFFTVEPNAVDSLLPAFEAAARKADLALIEEQVAHGVVALETMTEEVGHPAAGRGIVIYEMNAERATLEETFQLTTSAKGDVR